MKQKRNLWSIKKVNWLLACLISILGFGSMTSCDDENGMTEEYGTPHSKYSIKGKVVDPNNKAILGISVSILDKRKNPVDMSNSIKTDYQGEFDTTFSEFPNDEFLIVLEDSDGQLNGSFVNDTTKITFTEKDYYEKGERWYKGAAKKDITIVLKENKNNE